MKFSDLAKKHGFDPAKKTSKDDMRRSSRAIVLATEEYLMENDPFYLRDIVAEVSDAFKIPSYRAENYFNTHNFASSPVRKIRVVAAVKRLYGEFYTIENGAGSLVYYDEDRMLEFVRKSTSVQDVKVATFARRQK